MWALFYCDTNTDTLVGVFDTLAAAERAKGELVVKHGCGTSAYRVKEYVVNKVYDV